MIPRKHWDRSFVGWLTLCMVLFMFASAWAVQPHFCSVDMPGVVIPPVTAHVTADAFLAVSPDMFDTTPEVAAQKTSSMYVTYEEEQPGDNQFWPFSGGQKKPEPAPQVPPVHPPNPVPDQYPPTPLPGKPIQAPTKETQAPMANCSSGSCSQQVQTYQGGWGWRNGNSGWFGRGPARRQNRSYGVPVVRRIRLFGGC